MTICPHCNGDAIVAVEYPIGHKYRYNGVSEYVCYDCGYRQGHFCGQELKGNQVERVECHGDGHPYVVEI